MRAHVWLAVLALTGCNLVLDLAPPPTSDADAAIDAVTIPAPLWSMSDDFEQGNLARWTGQVQSAGASIDVATSGALSGCCAMHAVVPAGATGYAYAIISWPQATPSYAAVDSGTIAVRANVRAVALDRDTREMAFDEGGEQGLSFATNGLGSADATTTWGFLLKNPANAGFSLQSTRDVALGDWHCVEFVINVASAGHLAIYMDDDPVSLREGDADTTVDVGWDSLQLGLAYASGQTDTEIFIDDAKIALYPDTYHAIHLGCTP